MEAVILHGGQGTRLRPLTHTGPKQLIKIAGKPVSQWVLEQIREAGIKDIIIILGDNNPMRVIEYYGDGTHLDVNIRYVYQGKARGLADAVYRVKDMVSDKFIVYLGDNIVPYNLAKFSKFDGSASILLAKVNNPNRFGVAVIKDGKVIKLVEKPKEPISDLALVGVYAFTRDIFDSIENLKPSWRGELEITDAIQSLIDKGKEVKYEIVDGWWKDTGTPKDILEANSFLLDRYAIRKIEGEIKDSAVDGRVIIERGAVIENSTIRGPAYIGNSSKIKNSYIGPFTSIGKECTIDNSEIEYSVILDNVKLRGVSLRDSLIGNNSTVEKGGKWQELIIGENSSVII
ncbi:glucose-1-phosphate thymidyltransferase [Sulfolobus islandicus Y.G.57.14]|jgi:glucose-1-phosphate thymidylyltransferase|uniref:Glucose-1-phosphate thymidyltransferase n=5 Tax=Saccharolobus islandicus TaxID=43080 RepID=C3MNW9_SACI2|nr:glucose-1-phosphate thymidylyltransferase [Sulfolobus islandicus]ACP35082.1 glucose-1-phosphate thymidyltransferase [Sulfolobus islandicus L.S.2.15]ACP44867.1 glucose-1-phosphate thymidyltransferase [Sulfolobus islandicus Y.G.57.14]ACP49276.1 glucose-1-phosphate thymidyltransferase [Sulfolobus islandicus Y.N.15.51]ACR41254.1 glucose-1-phosphate thymidyltransferase [Sulfolobus islandicus M.16.4]ADB86378.1 glucose-1-phosphate thymidyltransferase [Sulfolobus islandicus L.D.8.5]